jgi:dTMP kinase
VCVCWSHSRNILADRSTAIGGLIDRYLRRDLDLPERSLHLLFSANRWELQSRLRALLESGVHVVVDRYAFSGVAYSMAKGLDPDWARQADLGIIRPDTVLYFDMDPEKAAERGGFGDERLEDAKLQRRVYAEMKLLRQPYWQVREGQSSMG